LIITDLSGKVVESHAQLTSQKEFSFGEQLSPGVYIASLWINEKYYTRKIIKQ
jgi:hypothetical protein